MVRHSLEDRAHIAFLVFLWLWWGGQAFLLQEKWKLWKRCCTRCPVGRGELKVTEAKMLPQSKALAVHVLDSAPTRAEANAWVASCSRIRGVHRRGKKRRLNFFLKVPGKFDLRKKPWWMSPDEYKRVSLHTWCFRQLWVGENRPYFN